jgi:two-component system response regulator NreC
VHTGQFPHPVFLHDALKAGAAGYALKAESLEGLIRAIHLAGTGQTFVSPELERFLSPPAVQIGDRFEQLTAREREILCLLLDGQSSKDIASSLFISVRTAEAHRLHINQKLGVRSPPALAYLLAQHGLLAGGP